MLSAHVERWRIVEAVKLGVNEFLCRPVSAKALQQRLISILIKPREVCGSANIMGRCHAARGWQRDSAIPSLRRRSPDV
jgi:hypothetical protein